MAARSAPTAAPRPQRDEKKFNLVEDRLTFLETAKTKAELPLAQAARLSL